MSQAHGWSPAGEHIVRLQTDNLSMRYSVSCIVSAFDAVPTFCDYRVASNDQVFFIATN
jgi:hypothetical protein